MNGKGDRDRTSNFKAYRDNPIWDKLGKDESESQRDKGRHVQSTLLHNGSDRRSS